MIVEWSLIFYTRSTLNRSKFRHSVFDVDSMSYQLNISDWGSFIKEFQRRRINASNEIEIRSNETILPSAHSIRNKERILMAITAHECLEYTVFFSHVSNDASSRVRKRCQQNVGTAMNTFLAS